jgi:hypothetical protein
LFVCFFWRFVLSALSVFGFYDGVAEKDEEKQNKKKDRFAFAFVCLRKGQR